MNELERIAVAVNGTPQVLWFKERFTPLMRTFLKLIEDGIIDNIEIHNPLLDMMDIHINTFRYEGNRYVLSYKKVGSVFDWYKLEKISPKSSSIRGTMVSSSDDDPKQESFMENVASMFSVTTPSELYSKLEGLR